MKTGSQSRKEAGTVFVIDDDESVRESIGDLLGSVGLTALLFESVQDFLQTPLAEGPGCIVLDIRMPGMSGLEFQQRMAELKIDYPVIFITGHGDIRTSVRAMKAGAIEFLAKPFHDQDLLDAIHAGLARDQVHRQEDASERILRERLATLNSRERDVMNLVVTGMLNKQIAAQLGVSEITVKVNRGNVMRKMQAASLADLVRIADKISGPASAMRGETGSHRKAART